MQPTLNFKIHGGKKLRGTIEVNSSKNGAVGILCASLLNRAPTTLHRCPRIEEVYRLLEVLESIGVAVSWEGSSVTLTPPQKFTLRGLNKDAAKRTRSIIMFIGPLLSHLTSFSLPQSGGCKLGSRTVRPHFFAMERLGVDIETTNDAYKIKHRGRSPAEIIMYESGDTATENAIMAAAGIEGETTIKYASANYMVQDLCFFLQELGVEIDGIGTTTLTIRGRTHISQPVEYTISEDPTDAMFYLAAAIATKSAITITRAPIDFVELELLVLEKMGLRFTTSTPYLSHNERTRLVDITTKPSKLIAPPEKVAARPYPGINMDNLPFFAIIATQAEGTTLIHDWVYEKRALYFTELDKLGAETLLADPHRVFVTGPTKLKPAELVCPPALRPATILLIGMLGASGNSLLRNVYSINRGYEDLAAKLSSLGADIELTRE
ncbi:UDP-N-acetylglucosamine 1-carboxyvinyltransferase [Patescibacteria group bacterium]|jgi:UDP-N-acetylglucosamine 1-carboxyvinyltransferase|nr:UDP-N-acetylglucosamine 1-carboxyvinyltransferase [Patescibacteria group bacterium]